MATYFGEVQELVSRAVDPDDLEEQLLFNLTTNTSENYSSDFKVENLIFCVGDIAVAFSECYLIPHSVKPLLSVYYSSDKDEDVSLLYGGKPKIQRTKVAATVYALQSDTAVCQIPFHVPETLHVELLDTILRFISCSCAFILTSAALVNLKGCLSSYSEGSYLMNLATSEFIPPADFNLPSLQSPNFVTGIPAAVLTEFEIQKKPALCIINYSDSNAIDFENVQAYEKLYTIGAIKKLINKDAPANLINYVKKHTNESNLYT